MSDLKHSPGLRGHVTGRDLGCGVTVLFVTADEVGKGPKLHWHPYDELFVIRRGRARFTVGDEVIEGGPGDVIRGPAHVPHRFEVIEAPYEAQDIHLNETWIQTDIED
ncbi:mannose-6-phosphate isomerase [Roseivivax marinus]|uniref:Mannose-6-phosphate isomerase n=1 Tax=Roseivivax marinus TaxID=1379903 RepID=W4HLR0_9RHOB|nr:cupin domain-containing protein [Roseivivax marinus]ETW13041.1 mannose-6-phosphate isomerase [Roseivivax marinus]SEL84973.1 Cupin domain-containing protein [Roseivivax marinus]